MAATLFKLPKVIVFDSSAALESGAKANFYITGTSTRQDTYTDKALTTPHDNPVVADGNGVLAPIYLDDTLNYKVDVTDSLNSSLAGYPVDDLATAATLVSDLASTANAKGASLVGIEDAAGNFLATDVEAALAETYSDLASTANALGASLLGIEDSASLITATTVEAALAEIWKRSGVTKFKTAAKSLATNIVIEDDNHLAGWELVNNKHYSIEGWLQYTQEVGNFQCAFQFSSAISFSGLGYSAFDESGVTVADHILIATTVFAPTTMTDTDEVSVFIKGGFLSNLFTGGTMDFQWAQETSDANNTTLGKHSWIRVTQLD